jgi:hypothetical protein
VATGYAACGAWDHVRRLTAQAQPSQLAVLTPRLSNLAAAPASLLVAFAQTIERTEDVALRAWGLLRVGRALVQQDPAKAEDVLAQAHQAADEMMTARRSTPVIGVGTVTIMMTDIRIELAAAIAAVRVTDADELVSQISDPATRAEAAGAVASTLLSKDPDDPSLLSRIRSIDQPKIRIDCLASLASALVEQDSQTALGLLREAGELATSLPTAPDWERDNALRRIIGCLTTLGLNGGEPATDEALTLARRLASPMYRCESLVSIATAWWTSFPELAADALADARSEAVAIEEPGPRAKALLHIGSSLASFDRAIASTMLEDAEQSVRSDGKAAGCSISCDLARAFVQIDHARARALLSAAAEAAVVDDDPERAIRYLREIAAVAAKFDSRYAGTVLGSAENRARALADRDLRVTDELTLSRPRRTWALAEIAPEYVGLEDGSGVWLQKADALAAEVDDPVWRGRASADILVALLGSQSPRELAARARLIQHPRMRSRTLVTLAEAATATDPEAALELLQEAEGIVTDPTGVPDDEALASIARGLSSVGGGEPSLVARAARIALTIVSGTLRDDTLARIVSDICSQVETNPDALVAAQDVARKIEYHTEKIEALARIAGTLGAEHPELATTLTLLEAEAFDIAEPIERVRALIHIARARARASLSDALDLLGQAEAAAALIKEDTPRAEVLKGLAVTVARLAPTDKAVIERALTISNQVPYEKANAVSEVVSLAVSHAPIDQSGIEGAIGLAEQRTVGIDLDFAYLNIVLNAARATVRDPDLVSQLQGVVDRIEEVGLRCWALAGLAQAVRSLDADYAEGKLSEAFALLETIESPIKRSKGLVRHAAALASCRPKEVAAILADAERVVDDFIEHHLNQAYTVLREISGVLIELSKADGTLLIHAERVARRIQYDIGGAPTALDALYDVAAALIGDGDMRGWQSLARTAINPGLGRLHDREGRLIRLGGADAIAAVTLNIGVES